MSDTEDYKVKSEEAIFEDLEVMSFDEFKKHKLQEAKKKVKEDADDDGGGDEDDDIDDKTLEESMECISESSKSKTYKFTLPKTDKKVEVTIDKKDDGSKGVSYKVGDGQQKSLSTTYKGDTSDTEIVKNLIKIIKSE